MRERQIETKEGKQRDNLGVEDRASPARRSDDRERGSQDRPSAANERTRLGIAAERAEHVQREERPRQALHATPFDLVTMRMPIRSQRLSSGIDRVSASSRRSCCSINTNGSLLS